MKTELETSINTACNCFTYAEVPMLKTNHNTQCEQHTRETVILEEETSYEQESDTEQEVFIRPPQAHTSMNVPYIKGPKMNSTVDDSLTTD